MNKIDPNARIAPSESANVLQIRKVGNSLGIILPKELLARVRLKEGDSLHVVEQPEGGFRLVKQRPDFDKAMQAARRGMKIYHNALAELAK
jgi:putative addiction module antidote